MEQNLSIEESIRFGWAKTRAHSKLIFQILLTLFAVQVAGEVVSRVLAGTFEGALASFALALLGIVLGIGYTLVTLRIAEGKSASYEEIVPSFRLSLAYIIANIVAGLVTVMPLILALVVCLVAFAVLPVTAATVVSAVVAIVACIAALYFMLRYAFVRFAILDDADIVKSLRTSAQVTRGRKWWLAGFFITVLLLNLLGAILLLVGLLVTIPITMFAMSHVYVKLHSHNR